MEYKKIPLINDTFDPNSFIYVLRKNILLYVILVVLSLCGGFIYLRYTPPMYESSAILQINKSDPDRPMLMNVGEAEGMMETNLTTLVELLRSPEFQKRILKRIPLSINYFSKGTFLTFELYKNCPYFVEITDTKPFLYETPINVNFINDSTFVLDYTIEGQHLSYKLHTNTWNDIHGGKIYLNISNYEEIKEYQKELGKQGYFFIPHSETSALQANMSGLEVIILSNEASTIMVDYVGNNPEKTADIANAISEDFLVYNVEKKQERANKILAFIDEQLKIVYDKLDDSERKLTNFKNENNIREDLHTLGSDKPFAIDQDITKKRNDELKAEIKLLTQLKTQLDQVSHLNTAEMLSRLNNSQSESMIINYLNAIGQLQAEKDRLLINVTENNQKIKVIDKQINSQKQLLKDFITLSNENLLAEIQALEKSHVPKRDSTRLKKKGFDEIEYSKLLRIYKVNEGFYNQLVETKAQYLIARAGHVSSNSILQKAKTPDAQIYPIKSRIYIIFFAISMIIICFITAIKYLLHNEITTLSDITKYTNAPIVGIIPNTRRAFKTNKRLLVENKPDSVFTESFRTFRSNLEFLSTTKTPKVVTVSSTISGEGKTFIALNLGGVLSFSGKKVILLDMDLRRPKVHVSFNVDNDKGMSTLLIGRNTLKECIKNTELKNLDFITAGPLPPNPSELATSEMFDSILEELKKTYDVIIIDTPPIGIVSDAIYSFQRSDYPIYVTRINYSRRNFIYNLNYIIDDKGIKKVSIVLNGIEIRTKGIRYGRGKYTQTYGYSYGYTYGYSYGYYGSHKDTDLKPRGISKILQYFNIFKFIKKDDM